MLSRVPDIRLGIFPENTTRIFSGTVKDENGTAIPGASLTTMTYTLYDEETLAIINGRNATSCKANVSAGGVLTLELLPADMVILAPTKGTETHRLLLEWTYAVGAKRGSFEAQIIVQDVEKVV